MRAFFLREEVQNHGVGGRLSRKASALRPASLLGNEHGGGHPGTPTASRLDLGKAEEGLPRGRVQRTDPGCGRLQTGPSAGSQLPLALLLKGA